MESNTSSTESINSEKPFNYSPLHIATESQSIEKTRLLLLEGADTDKQNYYGESAIVSPAIQGNDRMFALLAENGADLSKTNEVNEPIESLTQNTKIRNIAKQSDALDESYLDAAKNPNKANVTKLKNSLTKTSSDLWDPYKRLASKIGEDLNSSDRRTRAAATKIFKSITIDPDHKQPMLEASQEINQRLQNQGNNSLSNLIGKGQSR